METQPVATAKPSPVEFSDVYFTPEQRIEVRAVCDEYQRKIGNDVMRRAVLVGQSACAYLKCLLHAGNEGRKTLTTQNVRIRLKYLRFLEEPLGRKAEPEDVVDTLGAHVVVPDYVLEAIRKDFEIIKY